jgi:Ca2+-binding RTX toxin-like protein
MKSTQRNRNPQRRVFEFEKFEPRTMLAGITLQNIAGVSTVVIDGGAGNDAATVEVVNGNSVRATLNTQQAMFALSVVERIRFLGRAGNDQFTNSTSIDSAAFGHKGNDILRGGNGHNWIQGGEGSDNLFGGDRNDVLRGRNGDDYIEGRGNHDRLFGSFGVDTLIGGDGLDAVFGDAGNDILRGGNGNDRIFGGVDNDTIYGGDGNDRLDGGSGSDGISGELGNDEIHGGEDHDLINGGVGADTIGGDTGNDVLNGNEGNDMLLGGFGDDTISGGGGANAIDLGAGTNDIAVFDGNFGDYLVQASSQGIILSPHVASNGSSTVQNVSRIRFNDVERAASMFILNLNEAEVESLRLLNELRADQNRNPLTAVRDLSDFAEHWSEDVLPDDFRHSTVAEIQSLIIPGRTLYAENIVFIGSSSLSPIEAAREFHELWVNSSSHLGNMIDGRWTEVGIGLVRLSSGWYGTHSFANS